MSAEEHFQSELPLNRSVKEMHLEQQPREKLKRYGPESLSNAELLAIILRTGTRRMNVVQMSQALLDHFGGLRRLARKNWQELRVIPGIAEVKALILEAVLELGRRLQTASLGEQVQITCPSEAVAYFGPRLRDLPREVFLVAFLNNAKTVTGFRRISSGGATATIVDPAEVMRQAILNQAVSILLLHNHPSGNTAASRADVQLTRRLMESGKLLGIPVDDHIIIAGDGYTSLKAEGIVS